MRKYCARASPIGATIALPSRLWYRVMNAGNRAVLELQDLHLRGRSSPTALPHPRGGWDVSVDLRTLAVTRGSGVGADVAEALEWATMNRATLYATWGKLNERD